MIKKQPKRISYLFICVLLFCQASSIYAIDVSAPSAILIDANTGTTLYEKNSEVQRAMASTSKIMTYLLTMEAIDEGKITLNDQVIVSRNAAKTEGTTYKLKENDTLTVSELIGSMMVISANDSAVVLAEYVSGSVDDFVINMNNKARSLGLQSAYFVNPNGMPLANKDQNKISAKDLAFLSRHVLNNYEDQLIKITSQQQFYGTYKTFSKKNTNKLLTSTSFTDGLKTGYTDLAMYCLVSTTKVKDSNGNRLISVVLGGKTSVARFNDSQKMLEYGLNDFETKLIVQRGITVFVNGNQIICAPTQPFIKDETTLVPLGKIANELGAEIVWEPATKTITGKKGGTAFMLTIDKNQAIVNGSSVSLETAPVILGGTTMVPIKFIGESLGMDVKWESDTRTINLFSEQQ